jgi:uncharacterized protein
MNIICLTLVSFTAGLIGTLAGGGSNLVLMPLIDSLLGAQAVPPVVTTGMMLSNSQRILLFRQSIDWQVVQWYLPGAGVGAFLGAYVFTCAKLEGLQVLIGFFLVTTVFSSGFGKQEKSFTVRTWYFLLAGFLCSFVSGIIGSTGPALNTFYLNYGLNKEQMIATKAANVLVVNLTKMLIYAICGLLTRHYVLYGLAIGMAAAPANWIGQLVLRKINDERFKYLVNCLTVFSGAIILWEQRNSVFGLVNYFFIEIYLLATFLF